MKETIYYKKTKSFTEEKEFKCDVKNVFLSFSDSCNRTCYFGSFEYIDKNYISEDEKHNKIFRDELRIIQIKLLNDRIEYHSAGRHAQGSSFAIKNILETCNNVDKISREIFFKELKRLPLYQLF